MALPPLPPEPQASIRVVGEDDGGSFGTPVSELLATELDPPQWLIPGYLQEQSIGILAGPPGAGKTLQAFDWCAQLVAAGKRVFIAENEGGLAALQERLRRSCAAAGIPNPSDRYTYARNLGLGLSDIGAVKRFAKKLEYHDLILLDSLASFWPGLNENDPEHMGVVAEALIILREHSQAATLGIHHTTKAAWKPGEKPSLGDIRGHGAMAGRIDAAFICRPMGERREGVCRYELHVVKQRDGEWQSPKAVEVQMTGPAATVTAELLEGAAPFGGAERAEWRCREIEQQVLLVLPQSEENAISGNEICSRTRKAKSDVLNAIKRLFGRRSITQDYRGKYYRVKAAPSDPGFGRRYGQTNDD